MRDWGPRFAYTRALVDNYVPDIGGVYRLIYRDGQADNDYFIFYVGESNDLYRALKKHLADLQRELPPPLKPWNDPDGCIKRYLQDYQCYFRFIVIRSEKKRKRIKTKEEDALLHIPKGEMEFAAWADNFIRVLSANWAKWGIPADAWTNLSGSHKEYMASYEAQLKAKIARRSAQQKLSRERDPADTGKDAQQEGEEWKGGNKV